MILVVGATGLVGGMVTRGLLALGQEVRVLVREGSDYGPLVEAGATAVLGDLKEPETLAPACDGVEALVTTANSASRGGADTVETVDLDGNRHLVEAAAAAGVGRVVFVSALGASEDSPVPFLRAKAATEGHLRRSGTEWTVLQPDAFMDVWVTAVVGQPVLEGRPVHLVDGGRREHSLVAAQDVADYAVASLTAPAAVNAVVPIGGPSAVTWREVVDEFERQLGRPVEVRDLPLGAEVPGWPPVMSQLYGGMATYDSPVDMTRTAEVFGVTPTSLGDFVKSFLSASL
jgi:NADH dehydrogenase